MADKSDGKNRAFRGLILSFFFSFVNLGGILFTAISLNALGEWSHWQFVGLFGVYEAALGLACVILPNIWHMPVTEQETSRSTRVELALSALLLPHWGAIARTAAGLVLVGLSASQTNGFSAQSLLLLPAAVMHAWLVIGVSLLAARFGVARPDLDVVQVSIRWRNQTTEVPPISSSASVVQFLLGILTIPAAHTLSPSVLFQPALAPSSEAIAALLAATALTSALVLVAWVGRVAVNAKPEQQEEVEAKA